MIRSRNISYIERNFYFATWILAIIYALYNFATNSFIYFQNYKDYYQDFTTGWHCLSIKRDSADFEWETIFYLLYNFYPWIFVYLLISEIIHNLYSHAKVLQIWQISFTVFFLQFKFGFIFFCITLFQPIFFYLANSISKNKLLTWICTGISLLLITYCKHLSTTEKFQNYFLYLNDKELYIATLSLFWLNLKCSSYYLLEHKYEFLDFFSYCLYPPVIFTGPFISYKDFQNIYKVEEYLPIEKRIRRLVINFTRSLFWFLFGNFWLHYIYVNSTSFQPKLVKSFTSWSLYGYGYAMGQYFHMKYVIIYGLSTCCAAFENITTPHLPRCIGRIHLYSDMWKYFDPGLYTFLLRHIYIPIMKTLSSKLVASFLCFLFVYLWHGVEQYILIWSLLNYLGVTLEYLTNVFNKKYFNEKKLMELLNPYWVRRLKCFLAAPLLAISAISNFYFFAGTEIGNIFFKRMFLDEILINNLFLLLVLYCCCQVSMELSNVTANRMK